jgi:hypothetical protein
MRVIDVQGCCGSSTAACGFVYILQVAQSVYCCFSMSVLCCPAYACCEGTLFSGFACNSLKPCFLCTRWYWWVCNRVCPVVTGLLIAMHSAAAVKIGIVAHSS